MIPALLLQVTVPASTETSIMQNPAVVLAIITMLGLALVAAVKMILRGFERRLDERFAETKGRTEETADALANHVKDEETNVYSRLDSIKQGISDLKLSHMESMGRLSERVTRVETKLPNGALTDVLKALALSLERIHEPELVASAKRRTRA